MDRVRLLAFKLPCVRDAFLRDLARREAANGPALVGHNETLGRGELPRKGD
jgi:hypothetical protein